MLHGCNDCKHFRCHKYQWAPTEYDCVAGGPDTDELFDRIFVDGETWGDREEPMCSCYENKYMCDDYR